MSKKILAAVIASVVAGQAAAVTVIDTGTNKFSVGGHAGIRYEYDKGRNDNKTEAKGDASRINFQFESKLTDDITAYATTEWGFDVTKIGDVDFNNRLGFVGIKSNDFGSISLGKQWSSFSQVGMWTDTFATADGALGMYEDHEVLGTGRADDAIQYNLSYEGLNVSVQYQTGGKSARDTFYITDSDGGVKNKNKDGLNLRPGQDEDYERKRDAGYQIAVSYDLPMGLSVGVAYNQVKFVESSKKNARATLVGLKFEEGPIYAALTFGDYRNQASFSGLNTTDTDYDSGMSDNAIAKKARNIEFVGAYQLHENFKVQTGFMQLKAKDGGNLSQAKTQNVPVELLYTMGPLQLSGTYTFEQSRRISNSKVKDRFVAQARYYF